MTKIKQEDSSVYVNDRTGSLLLIVVLLSLVLILVISSVIIFLLRQVKRVSSRSRPLPHFLLCSLKHSKSNNDCSILKPDIPCRLLTSNSNNTELFQRSFVVDLAYFLVNAIAIVDRNIFFSSGKISGLLITANLCEKIEEFLAEITRIIYDPEPLESEDMESMIKAYNDLIEDIIEVAPSYSRNAISDFFVVSNGNGGIIQSPSSSLLSYFTKSWLVNEANFENTYCSDLEIPKKGENLFLTVRKFLNNFKSRFYQISLSKSQKIRRRFLAYRLLDSSRITDFSTDDEKLSPGAHHTTQHATKGNYDEPLLRMFSKDAIPLVSNVNHEANDGGIGESEGNRALSTSVFSLV